MAIKSRINLLTLFKENALPTENDFIDLIDSTLNKRDDHFFGAWSPGTKYCIGDVVLYEKSLYLLTMEGEEVLGGKEPAQKDPDCEEDEDTRRCICSTTPPGPDNENWCLLKLDMEDDDWKVGPSTAGGEPEFMYTKVKGIKVGIGTEAPEASLEVGDPSNGKKILLDPNMEADPTIKLKHDKSEKEGYEAKYSLGEGVNWISDAPLGYLFKKSKGGKSQKANPTDPTGKTEDLLLFLITSDPADRPTVGLGTANPEAMIDIKEDGKGQTLIQPAGKKDPQIIMVNLDPACAQNYFALSVGEAYSVLTTDARQGFKFKKGKDYREFKDTQNADHGEALMTIHSSGKIGIGTEDPASHLEVTDKHESGDVRISFENPNPSIATINVRPKGQNNYLTSGVDNDQAVFVTDSRNGFLFKEGGKCGDRGNEENINQGEALLRVDPKVKVGISTDPGSLQLIPTLSIEGLSRAFGQYIVASQNECAETGVLSDALAKVCQIQAIRYRLTDRTRIGDIGEQIGLRAYQVEEHFPELVMKSPDGSKAIAYQNFVAVLIQAINELTARVEELEGK